MSAKELTTHHGPQRLDPALNAAVRELYETSPLTYDEMARKLGLSSGTVSRIIARQVREFGMTPRGCGSVKKSHPRFRPRGKGAGPVYAAHEPDVAQYVNRAPCPRCGVREDLHGPSCRLTAHPTANEILAQPNYVNRAWERMLERAYENAAMGQAV